MVNLIATWEMAKEGVTAAVSLRGADIYETVEKAVTITEDNPLFTSVGTGGLPNEAGAVELDASFMNGATLGFGAVMSVSYIKNPIRAARMLSSQNRNTVLAGKGAEDYAAKRGLEMVNLLTRDSHEKWTGKVAEESAAQKPGAYEGHDTVCVIGLDGGGRMAAGGSTSGLFMKKPGRVGDTPLIGSGIYCDDETGGAAATGVGEDIMKGCLSYAIVLKMKSGQGPQEACEAALSEHCLNLGRKGVSFGHMSVIAMDNKGETGAATVREEFPYVVCEGGGAVMVRKAVALKY